MGSLTHAGHILELNKSIHKIIIKYSRIKQIPLQVKNKLATQLYEHNRVCYLVIAGSDQLFGTIMASFLLTHIPANIYVLGKNLFATQQLKDMLYFWLIAFAQVIVWLISISPLVWSNKVYHSPKNFIPKLQIMIMKNPNLRLFKFKYDDLYNRLIQGPQI